MDNLVSSRLEVLPDLECEAVWTKIPLCKNSYLLVGVCYRSPNASDKESDNLLKSIDAANRCAILFEDFNYPNMNWEKLDTDSNSKHFLDKVTDLFLEQQVKQPTRGANILDLVFTTESEMVNDVANCDHNILTWELACDATQRLNSIRLT